MAALRSRFVASALSLGREDFEAAAPKDGATRELTRAISSHIYEATYLDGVQFNSRHCDDMAMWALFERSSDSRVSPLLDAIEPGLQPTQCGSTSPVRRTVGSCS